MNIIDIPLVLPKGLIVDERDVGGFEFTVLTYNPERHGKDEKEPFLFYRYINPNDISDYTFNSRYDMNDLIAYLIEYNLI